MEGKNKYNQVLKSSFQLKYSKKQYILYVKAGVRQKLLEGISYGINSMILEPLNHFETIKQLENGEGVRCL